MNSCGYCVKYCTVSSDSSCYELHESSGIDLVFQFSVFTKSFCQTVSLIKFSYYSSQFSQPIYSRSLNLVCNLCTDTLAASWPAFPKRSSRRPRLRLSIMVVMTSAFFWLVKVKFLRSETCQLVVLQLGFKCHTGIGHYHGIQ